MDKIATPIDSKYLTGSQVEQDSTKGMTTQGFTNPGPTDRLRGVEANTGKRDGLWKSVPIEGITDLVYAVDDAPAYKVRED